MFTVRMFSLGGAAVMAAALLGGGSPGLAARHASPAVAETAFSGSAYGTEVNVASVVRSGRSALSTLGCTASTGLTHANTVASVTVPGLLASGTIDTSAATQATATGVASSSSATTEGVSLLGGLVSATAIKSVSTTSQNASTHDFGTSAAGTQFLGLSVAGLPVGGTPAPNTRLTLPGVGYVVLNQQAGHVHANSAHLTVIGIHVVVTLTTPLAPAGTNIVVSYASSDMGGPVSGLLDGQSYGAYANVAGGAVILGRAFPEYLGCTGTNGVTKTNGAALVSIPGVLSGTVVDTAEGTDTATTVSAETTSTVENLSLAGVVTATAVRADVTADGNPPALANHSSFLDLTVDGTPEGGTVPVNTKISLAGLGTLWLNRQFKSANKITVVMIQLIVTVPGNPLGLAPGAVVNVASASAGVH